MTWAKAIFWKNIDEFKSLIAAGDKLNDVIAPNGYTPLIYAARMGHPEMVRMLIQAGANPNARTERNESVIAMVRLSDAPSAVKDEIIRMLVGAGAPPEPLPVPEISLVEQVSLEREALRRKEQIKNEYPREKSLVERIEAAALVGHNLGDFLREAEIAENATALRLLFDHGVGVKSILTAFPLNKGNELAVQHFLLHGADVNSRGALERTPLFNVREPEILDFLLKAGAEVNVQDEFGQTPLMNAETREITRRLIAAGATINAIDEEGCTALMRIGGKRGIDLLIEAGADLNARDLIGKTALIHHCQNGDINSVRELIKANASLNIKDRLGKSAMQYAKLVLVRRAFFVIRSSPIGKFCRRLPVLRLFL